MSQVNKMSICYLCNSRRDNPDIAFFGFPRDSKTRSLWLSFCNLTPRATVDNMKICSRHFRPDDFSDNRFGGGYLRLKQNAVPSFRKPRDILKSSSSFNNKHTVIETDPLEIRATDSFSLFGDSVDNIEFVVESDEEGTSQDNPIIIHVTDFEEAIDESTKKQNLEKESVQEPYEEMHLDLDSLNTEDEIKDEVEVEDEVIQILSDSEQPPDPVPQSVTTNHKVSLKSIPEKTQSENKSSLPVKANTRCYVPNCTVASSEEDSLQWFNPPSDRNLRKVWDIAIDRTDKRLEGNDVVCHQHFADTDIVFTVNSQNIIIGVTLKDGAVPCLRFHEQCCVPGCNATTGQMFCFPVLHSSNFQLWLYMIKNPALKYLKIKDKLRHRVCAKHFEADCFENEHTLRSAAAPTLWIPEHNIIPISAPDGPPKPRTNTNISRPVVNLCCIFGDCKNKSLSGKTVFKFPLEPNSCIAWMKACKKERFISTPQMTMEALAKANLGVCEDHFEKTDFETPTKLKANAVPKLISLKFPIVGTSKSVSSPSIKDGQNIKEVPKLIKEQAFSGMCSYRGCYKKPSENTRFFNFPLSSARSAQWLKACGLSKISSLAKTQIVEKERICSDHFEPYMFATKNTLKHNAIPIMYKEAGDGENSETQNKNDNQDNSVKVISCAVPTCRQRYHASYGKGKFPDPTTETERFNLWLKLVKNMALDKLSPEQICSKYMICWRHFIPEFFIKDGNVDKLSKEAVPTRRLSNDIIWFYSTNYYKTKLQGFMKPGEEHEVYERDFADTYDKQMEIKDDTMCILEQNGLRFPKTGHFLYVERKENCKRKFPYGVYKYFKTGYGLRNDVNVGETLTIHTAIIIDDDDACERQVLQNLLDKRRKIN